MRLDRPIGTWLLLLPGWWGIWMAAEFHVGSLSGYGAYIACLFGIGAIMMRGAGCIINDLTDRDLDKRVERTAARPLASGAVKPFEAAALLALLMFLSLIILVQMSGLTIMLGFLSVAFIVAYPWMKRITWWPQAFLGLTFNFGALMGWAAIAQELALPALILYMGGIFWTIGYDTIYAHQDKEDDAIVGIRSTALLFGKNSRLIVTGFYVLAAACFSLSATMTYNSLSILLLCGPSYLVLFWQVLSWKPNDERSSLKMFRANRDFGLLFLIGLVSGTILLH